MRRTPKQLLNLELFRFLFVAALAAIAHHTHTRRWVLGVGEDQKTARARRNARFVYFIKKKDEFCPTCSGPTHILYYGFLNLIYVFWGEIILFYGFHDNSVQMVPPNGLRT